MHIPNDKDQMKLLLQFLLCLLVSFAGCGPKPELPSETVVDESAALYSLPVHDSLFIDSVLAATPFFNPQAGRVREFYAGRGYRVAWFSNQGINEQSSEVVNLINDYLESGIVDSSVFLKGIGALYDSLSVPSLDLRAHESEILVADILFTGQFFAFSDRAWQGQYTDRLRDLEWYLPPKKFSQVAYLDTLLKMKPSDIPGSEPVFRQYHELRKQLQHLVAVEQQGGWEIIHEPDRALKPGDTTSLAVLLRKRLELPERTGQQAVVYDSVLVAAVKSFQECHGISPTGIIDKKVIREMNVPISDRIRNVMINLERWKWIPPDPGSNFIAVNIPEFMLHVFEHGKEVWDMRVIVGKNVSQTTIFSGDIKYVVFAPYWNVPRSIAVQTILPGLKRDKNYLSAHRMEALRNGKVVKTGSVNWSDYSAGNLPFSFRQTPGSHNSLGLVKFLFPNSYAIYLHDTPVKSLFEEDDRDFSHGCIRLSEPQKLAAYLLRGDDSWDPESIRQAMHAGKEQSVTLEKPVPVYLTYFTAWVDRYGRLNFRDDLYGHDKKLGAMMFHE